MFIFKGEIKIGQRVKVYKNLHKKCYSIVDAKTGRVVAYADEVLLRDATFKVSEKGRQRVLREKRKNVHAYVVGTFALTYPVETLFKKVTYNPYKAGYFYNVETGEPVESSKIVWLSPEGVKIL
ncbi:hypothetical protein LG52_36 [Geobacillus kaustophilus]|jgi:hypothetical protein|uniref:Uncharacterized protein n=1 Tax=Geobacillus kaustophilus TaxID=1462 RepID=A0A0D8BSA4_GEOKU|nr:hypothetical protein [Geobacillus kaustophilus]KJE27041.1 hypothetical protein LG52_36 [Geobacillus kaustophilus]